MTRRSKRVPGEWVASGAVAAGIYGSMRDAGAAGAVEWLESPLGTYDRAV
jgi:hypothetical protein